MITSNQAKIAIACATGGFKGVFLHGVLSAFETAGFVTDAYAAASSSVPPAAAAAVGRANELGLDFWQQGLKLLAQPGIGMSGMVLAGIAENSPWLRPLLFDKPAPRFLIAANAVDPAGAEETQSRGARRRGRLLLLDAARGQRDWISEHLTLHLFDTLAEEDWLRLTAGNIDEIAYASSRMLHAWDIPAWVGGRPYVDAFYTCACPAMEVAELGYGTVIALATETVLYRDIFQDEIMPDEWSGATIYTIRPEADPVEFGVDFTGATEEGLERLYRHGIKQGQSFLAENHLGF